MTSYYNHTKKIAQMTYVFIQIVVFYCTIYMFVSKTEKKSIAIDSFVCTHVII